MLNWEITFSETFNYFQHFRYINYPYKLQMSSNNQNSFKLQVIKWNFVIFQGTYISFILSKPQELHSTKCISSGGLCMGVHFPVLHPRGAGGQGLAMGGPGVATPTDGFCLRLDTAKQKTFVIGNQIGRQIVKLNLPGKSCYC